MSGLHDFIEENQKIREENKHRKPIHERFIEFHAHDDEQIVFRGDHQRSKLENQTSPGTKRVIYNLKDQSYTIMTEN